MGLNEDPPVQLISQEPNPGVRYEYHLPLNAPRPGFSWSHGSWSECSAECGGGEGLARGKCSSPTGSGQVDETSACHEGHPGETQGLGDSVKGPT